MSTVRKITVAATVGSVQVIETNATTFGELKPELSNRGLDVSSLTFVEGNTNTEFSLDSAVLPTTDFQILAFPKKNKFGGIEDSIENMENDIDYISNTVSTIEEKLDFIIRNLNSRGTSDLSITNPSVSSEEQELLRKAEELRKRMYNED